MSIFDEGENTEFRDELPLLPIRDLVVYPFMILPLFVGRESSIKAVEYALAQTDRLILLAGQKDISAENPSTEEIYQMGTVAMIMRMRKLPDGRIKILIQGLNKAKIKEFQQSNPFFKVQLERIENLAHNPQDPAIEALMRTARELLEKVISLGKTISSDILMVLEDIHDPGRMADLVASNLHLKVIEAQEILEILDPLRRLERINQILQREVEVLNLQARIKSQVKDEFSKHNREYLFREQMRNLKNEIGGVPPGVGAEDPEKHDEFAEFRERILKSGMPEAVQKESMKQLARLEKMHPDSSESSIIRNYLECLVDLPWNISSKEDINLITAKSILDEDHFDLMKIKERILEFLAVRMLKGKQMKGPIICFAGPPGVGKTSLGKSIAKATGREFVRISLGGVKDEAEIRGHRRTYVGAMPGRFIQALQQAKTNNPIIMLDEVDKLGQDFKGDPSSALLEVLDPEQNFSFRDHYLNVPFDLSNTMFIATANVIENIPHPLRDRMEVLQLSGYTQEEKIKIAHKYLIPKQIEENGLKVENIDFTPDAIEKLIIHYTREAGLRNLERLIGTLCRKVAISVVNGQTGKKTIEFSDLENFLGPAYYVPAEDQQDHEVGIATGLAWTAFGGEILYIESLLMKGKGLTLTGQLGDVMKESARAALAHVRGNALEYNIDEDVFENYELHIHAPAGATPKDGPSAGITIATSIVSLLTNLPIDRNVAMTGEITLSGKVLPIGGLKEKALAALRLGIKNIIIPWKNKKDLQEIPEEYREKINFIPVKEFREVLDVALVGYHALKKPHVLKKIKKDKKRSEKPPMAA